MRLNYDFNNKILGPVVQSIVSLTSSLIEQNAGYKANYTLYLLLKNCEKQASNILPTINIEQLKRKYVLVYRWLGNKTS